MIGSLSRTLFNPRSTAGRAERDGKRIGIHNGLLYISGQVPLDPVSGEVVRASIEEETEAVLNNIKIIVEEAGSSMEAVLKVTCYLADIEDFPRFNEAYAKYFPQFPPDFVALCNKRIQRSLLFRGKRQRARLSLYILQLG